MSTMTKTSRRNFIGAASLGAIGFTLQGSVAAKIITDGNRFLFEKEYGGFVSDKKYVPVMITPYKKNGQIDFYALSGLIDFYRTAGAKGYFANCNSSEMYNLTPEERISLTSHVVKHAGKLMSVVSTGSFGETLYEKAEFTRKIYDTGVNGVITITGHFARANESDEVLIKNYDEFFKLTGNIPIGTYECPSPYKRVLTPEVFTYLLKSGRMVYHKDTTIDLDKVKVKIALAKNTKLEFYDACIANTMYSLQAGAKGMSPICGNLYPEIVAWMCNNSTNPDRQDDVKYIQEQLTKTEDLIGQHYPLSAKYFLRKRGLPIEVISRSNKDPLTSKQMETLDGVYKTFLGWCERIGLKPAKV